MNIDTSAAVSNYCTQFLSSNITVYNEVTQIVSRVTQSTYLFDFPLKFHRPKATDEKYHVNYIGHNENA